MDSVLDFRSWSIDTCIICDIKNNEEWVPSKILFTQGEIESEILYEDEHFFIIADIGPILEGHYLICSKHHISSYSYLDQSAFHALKLLKIKLRELLLPNYGKIFFFEHGSKDFSHCAGSCIDHAHIHVAPGKINYLPFFLRDYGFRKVEEEYVIEIRGKKEYLSYESAEGEFYIFDFAGGVRVPTQYFRRVLAELSGMAGFWNWRDHVKLADMLKTREKIQSARAIFISRMLETNLLVQ